MCRSNPTSDWDELAELIDASYRQVALKRQIAVLDAAAAGFEQPATR